MAVLGVALSTEDLVNGGIIASAVLSILLVALSTYGRRHCLHPALRFIAWGTSLLFLPLTSFIISSLLNSSEMKGCDGSIPAPPSCKPDVQNMWTVLLWTVLVLTIKCSADIAAVAVTATAASPDGGDVSIDGQRIRPPVEIVFTYLWVGYLIVVCFPIAGWVGNMRKAIFVAFSALGLAKMALKLAAFYCASRSFALGKNARLIAGYMEQLAGDGDDGQEQVPRYIVMGEKKKHVEERPQGYRVKREALDDKSSGLVTLDRVWRLAEHGHGDGILAKRLELRDLCLSYSLFKILRRRLSGYPVAEAGSAEALEFVLRGMGSVGSGVYGDRVFRILVDELWFASDFYYSPIPLSTFGGWYAILDFLCSSLIVVGAVAVGLIYHNNKLLNSTQYKIAITFSLLLALMVVETWEIISGLCSNWTKMALLGHYMRHRSMWCKSSYIHAALTAVLQLRPARRWRDKLGQNSVLEPRRFRKRQIGLLSKLLYGSSGSGHMKSIHVSPHVKEAVLTSLQSSYSALSGNGGAAAPARRVGVGGRVDWARYGFQTSWAWDDGEGGSNTEEILTWHVATRLFELKMKSKTASSEMIAACHLSYYCAYLVAVAPELLPDCDAWTKRRYEEVSDDVMSAAAALGADGGGESIAERYEQLVQALSKDSRDTVLRRGADLGRHLVEAYENEESACPCKILADFWSEMLLYVAPSENVKGHVQAMARGGEFITLVWALLLHAGVTTRPETTPGGATAIP